MRRLLKWFMMLIALGLITIIVAVYGAIHYAQSDKFKGDVIAKLEEETGRKLTIEGDLNLSIYPWAGVDINGLTLANARGFGDKPFLKADKIALRIKTLPLLKKRYELDTLKLHGAEINLAKNKDGVSNWDDLLGEKDDDSASKQAPELTAVILGGVDIKDGKLHWKDETTGQTIELSKLSASTGELTFGDPIELVASLSAVSNQPAINGDVKLKGTLNYDLDNELYTIKPFNVTALLKGKNVPGGKTELTFDTNVAVDLNKETASISGLTLNALDTKLTAEINARDVQSDDLSLDGDLALQGQDLAKLFKILEIEPLASQLAKRKDKSFQIVSKVNLNLDDESLTIPELTAKLLGADIKANVTASNIQQASPSAQGKLSAKGDNLPLLLQVLGQFQGGEEPTLSNLGKDLGKLKDKSFDIATEFNSDLEKGVVNVPALAAKLLGARINGQVSAQNLNDESPVLKGQLKAKGPDLPSLLRLAGNLQKGESGLADMGKKLSVVSERSFDIDTVFDVDQKSGNIDVSKLNARALGLNINGNMKSRKDTLSGKLSIKGEKLKGLLTAFDQKDLGDVLKTIDINAGLKGSSQDMQLSPLNLKATLSGKNIPNSPVDLVMTGDTRANLDKQTLSIKNLSLKGLGLDLKGNISATDIDKDANFEGDLSVAPFDLRQFLKQLNQPAPKTADKTVLKKFALSSKLKGNNNSLSLNDIKMILDDSELRGDLAVQNFEKPAITFGIGINKINADRYMPPETKAKATPETAAAGAAQLPLDTLRALNVKGDLLVGSLIYSNLKLKNFQLSFDAKDGKIKLNPAKAQLYDGEYAGNITLNATGKIPKLTMNTNLSNVQAEPLLKDMMGEAQLKGKGDISMALLSAGADVNTLKKTLSGTGQIKFQEGVMRGVDVGHVLKQAEVMFESKQFGDIDKGEETHFDSLTATLDIDRGVVNNKDMLMTAPGFKVTGEGIMANLNDESWRYNLKVKVDETTTTSGGSNYNLGGYDIPVKCRGLIKDFNCKPDTGEIAKVVLKKAGEEKLKELVGDVLGIEKKTTAPAPTEKTAPKKIEKPEDLLKEGLKGILDF